MRAETDISIGPEVQRIYDRFLARASRDDEFSDWAGYREQLTDFILRSVPAGRSLLILGAGKCSDLDLKRLADHCGTVTLSDYRPETAEAAFRQYGLSPSEQLGFLESDYVGITDGSYLEYTELLLGVMRKLTGGTGESLEEAAGPELEQLRQGLEQIYRSIENYRIDLGDETCDVAVVCGVHSQLNNAFRGIFQYVRKDVEDECGQVRFVKELNDAVFQVTRRHTEELVRRFNEAVFAAAKEGVIYGYEKSIIYTPEGAGGPVIGTVDGARQAGEAIADLPASDRMSCLWPLSRRRGIKFEMSICYLPAGGFSPHDCGGQTEERKGPMA